MNEIIQQQIDREIDKAETDLREKTVRAFSTAFCKKSFEILEDPLLVDWVGGKTSVSSELDASTIKQESEAPLKLRHLCYFHTMSFSKYMKGLEKTFQAKADEILSTRYSHFINVHGLFVNIEVKSWQATVPYPQEKCKIVITYTLKIPFGM